MMHIKLILVAGMISLIVCSCGRINENIPDIKTAQNLENEASKKPEQNSLEELTEEKNKQNFQKDSRTKSVSKIKLFYHKIIKTEAGKIATIQPDGNIIYTTDGRVSTCPVKYENAISLYDNVNTILILQNNGKVVADYIDSSSKQYFEHIILSLKNVADIIFINKINNPYSDLNDAIVLYKDGTVGFADNTYAQSKRRIKTNEEISSWTNIRHVCYPNSNIVLGVKTDGTVVSSFNYDNLNSYISYDDKDTQQQLYQFQNELNSWTDIEKIACYNILASNTIYYGLKSNGQVIVTSFPTQDYSVNGVYAKYINAIEQMTDVIDIVPANGIVTHGNYAVLYALKNDGSVSIVSINIFQNELRTGTLLGANIEAIAVGVYEEDMVGLKMDGSLITLSPDDIFNTEVFQEFSHLSEIDKQPVVQQDYIISNSDSVYLTQEDVKNLSTEELRIARNEIYARHGRKFLAQDLQEYFNHKEWYQGLIEPSDFKESLLNDYEKKNVEFIKKLEENAP